jgi:hypothetical protein
MNSYILQPSEFYKSCSKSYLHTKPLPVYPNNCNPKVSYTCSTNTKKWEEPRKDDRESIMKNNIYYGGIICDNVPRTNINNYVSSRNMTSFVQHPNQYTNAIDVESSLLYSTHTC